MSDRPTQLKVFFQCLIIISVISDTHGRIEVNMEERRRLCFLFLEQSRDEVVKVKWLYCSHVVS